METLQQLQQQLPSFAFTVFKFFNGLILLLIVLVPLEKLFALHPQKTLRKGFFTDIAYYFLTSLLPNKLLLIPMALLALALPYLADSTMHQWMATIPLWPRFALALVVAEIGFYWGHRWMHQSDFLWRFHAVHHSPETMDWLVNSHAHPVDLVLMRLCGFTPLYLLGLAQPTANTVDWPPLLVALVGSVWGYFIHANIRWRFGRLEHLIATPAFHHWHHNNQGAEHRHQNYAPMLPWIDKLFGTFHLDTQQWPLQYGIEKPIEGDLTEQILHPFLPPAPTQD